jgi:aminotransferase
VDETRTADPRREEIDIFALQELANRTPDLISFGLGDPDLPTPPHIVEAAKRAIDEGRTGPAPTNGLIELREAIAHKLQRANGIEVDPELEVLVTTGSQEALFLLIQSLIDPGDEVLVPDPRYPAYDAAINLAGGKIVLVPTSEEHGFELQPNDVEAAITERTKALLLITPSNPTAAVIPPANLRAIAELARQHDLIVISDEIYESFLYDGAEHLSIGSLPGMRERTITLNGLSKAYAMTGWRVGYIAAPAEFIRAVSSLKAMINVHAPTVSQWAAVAALDGPQEPVAEMREIYASRRKLLMNALDDMGFSYSPPRGAFYIWANSSASGMDAMALSYHWLQEAAVMVFPGSGFGDAWRDYMRFTLLQPEPAMREAIQRLKRVTDVRAE